MESKESKPAESHSSDDEVQEQPPPCPSTDVSSESEDEAEDEPKKTNGREPGPEATKPKEVLDKLTVKKAEGFPIVPLVILCLAVFLGSSITTHWLIHTYKHGEWKTAGDLHRLIVDDKAVDRDCYDISLQSRCHKESKCHVCEHPGTSEIPKYWVCVDATIPCTTLTDYEVYRDMAARATA